MNSGKLERDKRNKQKSFKRFLNSIKYSVDGLKYAYQNEQSLWLHGMGSLLIIILGLVFRITFIRWAILIIASVVVMAIELLNTAIEATVDMITKDYHPLAKIAKDCGSAAGGVAGVMLAIISVVIFMPYIIALFN